MTDTDSEHLRTDLQWLRDRVLNVVGHELRTPAATIRGLADALADPRTSGDPARAAELIGALQRHAIRLERLVDDLLAANGVTTSLPVGDPAPVDLVPLLRQAWLEAGGTADALVLDLGPTAVVARPQSIRRILDHVFANALTLGSGHATVSTRESGGVVALTVDSPGPALSAEDVRFATEAFWRGERAVTSAPGLGLGLTVARALAEHEQGDVTVAGLDGGGLRTTIGLPGA